MAGKAAKVVVTEKQLALLEELVAARSTPVGLQTRCRVIVMAQQGHNNEAIEAAVGLGHGRDQKGQARSKGSGPILFGTGVAFTRFQAVLVWH